MKTKIKVNSVLFIFLLVLLIFLIGLSNLHAQETSSGKNQFSRSISDVIPLELTHFFGALMSAIDDKRFQLENTTTGMLHFNYQKHVS